ncbi:unnamed protein product, partial [Iphiclides podalirius]
MFRSRADSVRYHDPVRSLALSKQAPGGEAAFRCAGAEPRRSGRMFYSTPASAPRNRARASCRAPTWPTSALPRGPRWCACRCWQADVTFQVVPRPLARWRWRFKTASATAGRGARGSAAVGRVSARVSRNSPLCAQPAHRGRHSRSDSGRDVTSAYQPPVTRGARNAANGRCEIRAAFPGLDRRPQISPRAVSLKRSRAALPRRVKKKDEWGKKA